MKPPCEDIRDILLAEGIVSAGQAHLTRMPESPDSSIAILDQAGSPPDHIGGDYYRPMVQILVRGGRHAYPATRTIAENIHTFLHGYGSALVNDTHYVGIWASSDIIPLGYDSSDRPSFSLNFAIHRTQRRV